MSMDRLRRAATRALLGLVVLSLLGWQSSLAAQPPSELSHPLEHASLDPASAARVRPSEPVSVPMVAPGPLGAPRAAEIVLGPADLGPMFVVASHGERAQADLSWCAQNLTRAGPQLRVVEPDGIQFIRSVANVVPDSEQAERELARAARELFDGADEIAVENIGDRTRAAVDWGPGPFDPARRVLVFRVDRVVGAIIVVSYEAPDDFGEVLRLATIMAGRAGG